MSESVSKSRATQEARRPALYTMHAPMGAWNAHMHRRSGRSGPRVRLCRRLRGTGHRAQGTGYRVHGTGYRVHGTRYRVHGTWYRVRGNGHLVSLCRRLRKRSELEHRHYVRVDLHISRARECVEGKRDLDHVAVVEQRAEQPLLSEGGG